MEPLASSPLIMWEKSMFSFFKSSKSRIFSAFQVGRIQDTEPYSHKTNIWDITYATEGQPLSPTLRLITWSVSKLEPTPFVLQVKHQVCVQAQGSRGTSLSAGFGGLSPALPTQRPYNDCFAKWWQLYSLLCPQGLSHSEHSIDGFAALILSNARKASHSIGCLEGMC